MGHDKVVGQFLCVPGFEGRKNRHFLVLRNRPKEMA